MESNEFAILLDEATRACVAVAKEQVTDSLPPSVVYRVFPNQSNDDELRPGEEVFPEDTLAKDEFHLMTSDEVVEFFWRNGKVPEWIDLNVVAVAAGRTVVEVNACGRFTANREFHYYRQAGGLAPFGVKSPYFPPGVDATSGVKHALCNPRSVR